NIGHKFLLNVQTFQWISHCVYDDQKGVCEGYEKYGYNGEDFISLDVNQASYIPHTADAAPIADIWNKRRDRIGLVKHYFTKELPDYLRRWLWSLLAKCKNIFTNVLIFPDVYLLQKNSSSPVVCLATGVNSSAVTMTWRKNEQDLHEDVDEGETVPNGDGTFQKRISLKVETEEWKENHYHCVVQHEKMMIIKSITEDRTLHITFIAHFPSIGKPFHNANNPLTIGFLECSWFFICFTENKIYFKPL
uniref:Ig-like domain-containing protein n=1 Tax=Pygocentrus nattereri TaxID=42514 RepID=A0A3B4EFN7_PYGNA